jgi:hypothetical protein
MTVEERAIKEQYICVTTQLSSRSNFIGDKHATCIFPVSMACRPWDCFNSNSDEALTQQSSHGDNNGDTSSLSPSPET